MAQEPENKAIKSIAVGKKSAICLELYFGGIYQPFHNFTKAIQSGFNVLNNFPGKNIWLWQVI